MAATMVFPYSDPFRSWGEKKVRAGYHAGFEDNPAAYMALMVRTNISSQF